MPSIWRGPATEVNAGGDRSVQDGSFAINYPQIEFLYENNQFLMILNLKMHIVL